MKVQIETIAVEQKEILRNLLEKYLYEFSFYTHEDVNNLGLFGYKYLDNYWTEANRFPYFIVVDKKIAGFALFNNYQELDFDSSYCMSEFFILPNYRNKGIGEQACKKIFLKHPGDWQLQYHPDNDKSKYFWNKIITKYATNIKHIKNYEGSNYPNDVHGSVFLFTVNQT